MINCTRCPCYQNEYGINCVPFSGNPNADVYFLGEMAGRTEAEASRFVPSHFIGRAGQILDHLLSLSDIKREDVAIANSLRCYKAENGKPTKKELESCFIHTYNEVRQIKPKLIVLLGDTALKLALGVDGISSYRGKLLWSDKLQCNVLPTYHPMAIGYDPTKREAVEGDFRGIASILKQERKEIKLYDYVYITDPDDFRLEWMRDEMRDAAYLSLDIESAGLDYYNDPLRIVQIGIGKEPIYVFDSAVLQSLQPFLKQVIESKPIIGQTFDFDVKYLYTHLNIFPENWYFDTCLAEFMLTGMKDNDLTSLVAKYCPESIGYDTEIGMLGGAQNVRDMVKLVTYGACDAGVLFPIMKKQMKQLVNEGMWWYFSNVMMPCNRTLCKLSLRGVKYDLEQLYKVDKEYQDRGESFLLQALKLPGIDETEKFFNKKFNPKSPLHVKYLLLKYYDLPILKKTKKKEASIGSEEMEKYSTAPFNNKYCKVMKRYRGVAAMRSNFLSGVLPKLHEGVAHTKYSLHSVSTSRPNSRDPNLLNLPNRSEDKNIKSTIVARDGYTFVAADESQVEIRVAGVVYDDEKLIAACNLLDSDFHSSIASSIYKIPYDEFYSKYKAGDAHIEDLRTAAKSISFGTLYGMSKIALAYRLGITEGKAQEYIENYFAQFPDLSANMKKAEEFVKANGYIRNYFGFKRYWGKEILDDDAVVREAINLLIQSVAWNLVQLCLIQLDNEFGILEKSIKSNGLVMQVYDSIICEVRDQEIDIYAQKMRQVMTEVNKPFPSLNRVQLKVDIKVGKNLRDLEKYDFN